MDILFKNFLVYGTGLSNESAISFLLKKGAKTVYVYDDYNDKKFENTTVITNFEDIINLDISLVIISPGVQIIGNKNIEFLKEHKIKFMSEFCFGFLCCKGKKICITGTNGKTTTVNLLFSMLKTKYKNNVFLCGNTDTPISAVIDKTTENSLLVCEVSSFALESITKDFRPNISAILNITTDHIIRHKTMKNYVNAKMNITKFQNFTDTFVCHSDFNVKTKAQKIVYSQNNQTNGAYIVKNNIFFDYKKVVSKNKIKLLGEKNLQNVLCAITIAKLLKVKNSQIKRTIKNFVPPKHRMQKVYEKNKVVFVDDSKATNPDATICALECFYSPTILLLGGSDKGYVYDSIFSHTKNVKQIITFGAMAKQIEDCAIKNSYKNTKSFETLHNAVVFAKQIAKKGDVVLLSPACASFDEFESYKQRGEKFLEYVKEDNEKT